MNPTHLVVVGKALAELWAEIVGCADSGLGTVVGVLEHTCNAEVSNFYLSVLGHEDVLSF